MVKEKEIAEYYGIDSRNIRVKKKDHYDQYELIRLGAICKKYNLTEDKLEILLSNNNLEKALKTIEIFQE